MPRQLVVKGLHPNDWSGSSIAVCVLCGYVTSVTNVHRNCPEMPADAEMVSPVFCYSHTPGGKKRTNEKQQPAIHFITQDKVKIWTAHDTIGMVAVSKRRLP